MRSHAETKTDTRTPSRSNATPAPNALAHKAQLCHALRRAGVQLRLEIGAANDALEHEADDACVHLQNMGCPPRTV